jgi:hypothetical protein
MCDRLGTCWFNCRFSNRKSWSPSSFDVVSHVIDGMKLQWCRGWVKRTWATTAIETN